MHGISYWIDKRALTTPHRVALLNETRKLTYNEMAQEVNQLARTLYEYYRIREGDRVAILSNNRIEYIQLFFALAKLGCIVVPLNTRLTPAELEFQLKDSGASSLILAQDFLETGLQLQAACSLKHVISLDETEQTSALLQQASQHDSSHLDPLDIDWNQPFIICYTSGTTGRPKGAVLTHQNMYWNAINNIVALDIHSEDVVITLLPLFHIGGVGLFAFPALFAGATVVVPKRFEPTATLKMIENESVSIVMGVPTILDLLRKSPQFAATNFESIRWFYSGGAPCPHELLHFYHDRNLPLGQGFGLTETSPSVFMLSKEDYKRKLGSIGKPVMACDVRIVGDNGQEVGANEVGELVVRGPNVIKEYWNLPEEQGKSFKDGWFYTGDLVKKDAEGFFYITGRKKEMIISGGENVYPLEVEQVLQKHPAVEEVAIIGVPHEKWGEVPFAIIAVKAGYASSVEAELRRHCLEQLAKYKAPHHYEFVNALPKNATGKIDKAGLKNMYSSVLEK